MYNIFQSLNYYEVAAIFAGLAVFANLAFLGKVFYVLRRSLRLHFRVSGHEFDCDPRLSNRKIIEEVERTLHR